MNSRRENTSVKFRDVGEGEFVLTHPAAPGSIVGVPKTFTLNVTALVRGKWTEA